MGYGLPIWQVQSSLFKANGQKGKINRWRSMDSAAGKMKKTILIYGLVLAGGALALQQMEYLYSIRTYSTETYIVLIAVLFTVLGAWAGHKLTHRPPGGIPPFQKNKKAQRSLGISERECQVLELVARGHSNKEIADRIFISTNTVKTHLAHLYDKLDVSRHTQAVQKAKSLQLIP